MTSSSLPDRPHPGKTALARTGSVLIPGQRPHPGLDPGYPPVCPVPDGAAASEKSPNCWPGRSP